jgi:hypothetical protein
MIVRRFGWAALLAVGMLAFSAHYSRLAPCGAWGNAIFGEEAWGESDPGSFYFAAAHELAWGEAPLFVGHPGAPLLPLLRAVQSGAYQLLSDGEVSFTRFTAQHLPLLFLVSKLLMTLLHLLSFVALYALARQLLRDPRAAALATLGYATCLPVLYYLSRISAEPVLVAGFAAAFFAVFRYEDLARAGRTRAAFGWLAGAGVAAVSAAMAKLAFGGPLPFLLALQIVLGCGRSEAGGEIARRTRGLALAVFVASAVVSLALYSQIIDWAQFVAAWRQIGSRPVSEGWTLSALAPGLGASSLYPTAELVFLVCAAVGWGLFLRRRPEERRRALWLSAYGLYGLAFFAYRVALEGNFLPFHYAFVLQAVAALFFGYAGLLAWQRVGGWAGWRAVAACVAGLALVHGVAVAAVVDSRRHDVLRFAERRPAFPLVARLEPGDRLLIVQSRWREKMLRRQLTRVHGFFFPLMFHPRESTLLREFNGFFSAVPPKRVPPGAPRKFVPVLGANVVLLRGRGDGAP